MVCRQMSLASSHKTCFVKMSSWPTSHKLLAPCLMVTVESSNFLVLTPRQALQDLGASTSWRSLVSHLWALALSLVAYFGDDIEGKYSALGIVLVTSTICEVIIARPCASASYIFFSCNS